MKAAPFSLAEAEHLCKHWHTLIGEPFDNESKAVIDCIAIAPFDQLNREKFIAYYLLFNDCKKALSFEYKGLLYAVLVIAVSEDKFQVYNEEITMWLTRNNYMDQVCSSPTYCDHLPPAPRQPPASGQE